jgi:dolichol-phosphate mannosyltransferase
MSELISIMSPCFNEEDNIRELYERICKSVESLIKYDFEFIFIDNASDDKTVNILKEIAQSDRRVKVIINVRNFGPVRSPYWALLQTSGKATIGLASDLQDPPELIPQFIEHWENGCKVVFGTKQQSQTNRLVHKLRKIYYHFLDSISDVKIIKDATGFGLYDAEVVEHIRKINDPYPYFRGLISELGYPIKTISFDQPKRAYGISSNNFYSLFDTAMLGVITHSILPIRIASFLGIIVGFMSILVGLFYLTMKLIYWDDYPLGITPVLIGVFFMFGLILIFIGILGEYIASIHSYVRNRPIVVEKERINF